MAKRRINTFPDRILKEIAKPVSSIEKIHQVLAEDMLETMYDAPGIGLAANQVGVPERIIVLDTEYDLEEPESDGASLITPIVRNKDPKILINPEIIYREGKILFKEACLSVPEYSAEIKRAEIIKVSFKTIDGLTKILSAEGLMAVALQHEIDHLDGKLFIDRMNPLKKELAKKRLLNERQERDSRPVSSHFQKTPSGGKREKGF